MGLGYGAEGLRIWFMDWDLWFQTRIGLGFRSGARSLLGGGAGWRP